MRKLSKNELKKVAAIYAHENLFNAMGAGACSQYLTAEDEQYFQDQLERLGERLFKHGGYMGLGELDQIIEKVVNKEI